MKNADSALDAVLADDEDKASRLIAELLPKERQELHAAALKLAVLAGGESPSYLVAVAMGMLAFMFTSIGSLMSGLTEPVSWLLGVGIGALVCRLLWGRV